MHLLYFKKALETFQREMLNFFSKKASQNFLFKNFQE